MCLSNMLLAVCTLSVVVSAEMEAAQFYPATITQQDTRNVYLYLPIRVQSLNFFLKSFLLMIVEMMLEA